MGRFWSSFVLVLLVTACGTKRNPEVCCTTAADCEALGVPQDFQCPGGEVCVQNTCVQPETCQAASDCVAPTPHCADGTCSECVDDSHCGDLRCDPMQHGCVECLDSSDCDNRVCNTATNTCELCTSNDQCESGFCELGSGTCRGDTIVPRFVPDACDIPAAEDLVVDATTTIDTTTSCNAGTVPQPDGPEICVLRYRTITIAAGATLGVSGTRVVALVADDALTVDGFVGVSAGGEFQRSGGANTSLVGGGGAGYATAGAAGGSGMVDGGAGNGGAMRALGSILLGGTTAGSDSAGRGGGGATLVSCKGQITISGTATLAASGGGGGAGSFVDGVLIGGGGGGAGGTFVLQGMNVRVEGQAYSNGGGGGSGAPSTIPGADSYGRNGLSGRLSTMPASGGTKENGGIGGDGGTGTVPPAVGQRPTPATGTTPSPGGGGGSVGVHQVLTPVGVGAVIAPSAASPAFEAMSALATR